MSSSSSTIPSIATNCKDSSPVNIPYLPDELLFNCLARVSRLHYPTLFLVSKRFRSLLASDSKEIYENRKLESCLYVCLSFPPEYYPSWFTLCMKPTRNPKPTLVSIPTQGYFPTRWSDLIAVGSNIYMIGGYETFEHSSKVLFVMDCRSHTWSETPSMRVARKKPYTCVLDGKLYVYGGIGIEDYNSANWIECFDPKTQKWEHVPSPGSEICQSEIFETFSNKGKLYVLGNHEDVVYNPEEKRWDPVGYGMDFARPPVYETLMEWVHDDSSCVIDNVSYSYESSLIWYDSKRRCWSGVYVEEEEEELPELTYHRVVRLVDFGGKLAVLWEEKVSDFWSAIASNEIWCAVISLERRDERWIYGKVEWCEVVFTVRKRCYIDKCIAVTV